LQRSIGLEFFGGENNERRLHALLSVRQAAMLLYTMSLEIALGGTSASYGVLVELVYRKSDITEIGFHVSFFFFPLLSRVSSTRAISPKIFVVLGGRAWYELILQHWLQIAELSAFFVRSCVGFTHTPKSWVFGWLVPIKL